MTETCVCNSQSSESGTCVADHQWVPAPTMPDSSTFGWSEAFAFEDLVQRMLASGGPAKQKAADEMINRIMIDEDRSTRATRAAWASYLILQSAKPGRLADCVGILARLGPNVVRECILDAIVSRPSALDKQHAIAEDYWFAVVRSLGYLCKQGHTGTFRTTIEMASSFPVDSIREASVFALLDIGDKIAMERLSEIATSDPSRAVRETARECLEDADD